MNVEFSESSFPLSYGQSALYHAYLQNPDDTSYNIGICFHFDAGCDLDLIKEKCAVIAKRHSMLRARILHQPMPVQAIEDALQVPFEHVATGNETLAQTRARIRKLYLKPFQLDEGSLFQVFAVSGRAGEVFLLMKFHHIVCDGRSLMLIADEFKQLLSNKSGHELATVEAEYKSFIEETAAWVNSGMAAKHRDYWRRKLSGASRIPFTEKSRATVCAENQSHVLDFQKAVISELRMIAKKQSATLYITILSAFFLFLYRFTATTDMLIDSPTLGRNKPGYGHTIGYFINLISIRISNLHGKITFLDLVDLVRKEVYDSMNYMEYPYSLVLTEAGLQHTSMEENTIRVMFNLQKPNSDEFGQLISENPEPVTWGAQTILSIQPMEQEGVYDLILDLMERKENISGSFKYRVECFSANTVAIMSKSFATMLKDIASTPEKQLLDFSMLSHDEHTSVLYKWNNTVTPYPREKNVHQVFEDIAGMYRQKNAIVFDGLVVSYGALNEQANKLAKYLVRMGLGAETLVGVFMERSHHLIVALLAILKAGGAYLTIEHTAPKERVRAILEDSKIGFLITSRRSQQLVSDYSLKKIIVDNDSKEWEDESSVNLDLPIGTRRLMYVMYTSGSSGTPKGIMVEHRSAVRLVRNTNYFQFSPDDKLLQLGAVSFDATTFELWGMLLNGGTVYLATEELLADNDLIALYCNQNRIDVVFITTAWFNQLVSNNISMFENLRFVLTGGEKVSEKHIKMLKTRFPDLIVVHCYGPTENTTFSTYYVVPAVFETIPIGRPIANTQTYLLDDLLLPVPIGMPGQICLGGDGVARGYLNNPELTRTSFVRNPYGAGGEESLMYLTGDFGKWRDDGIIDFIGRKDSQIKLNGYRIELDEIQTVVLMYPEIKVCQVLYKALPEQGNKIVAYIVLQHADRFRLDDLQKYLRERLPVYMMPSIVVLDHLPINKNGKIDRKILLSMSDGRPTTMIKENLSDTEKKIKNFWQEILSIETVGVNDNFFDLGGNSLMVRSVHRLLKENQKHEIPIIALFEYPTIRKLAAYIDGKVQRNAVDNEAVMAKRNTRRQSQRKRFSGEN